MANFWNALRRYREYFSNPNYSQEQKRLEALDEIASLKAQVATKLIELKSRGLQDHDQEVIDAKEKYMDGWRALLVASRQDVDPSFFANPSDTASAIDVITEETRDRIIELQRAQAQAYAQAYAQAQMIRDRDEALALQSASEPMDPSEPD